MTIKGRHLTVAIIAGEESGDILGADLVGALQEKTGAEISLVGVGGENLKAIGLTPLFDADDIALMGISAVLRDLPRLVMRIGKTASTIAEAKPDCLILIDSPAFNLRVARKVRALAPDIPIFKYVCPSVWAWNPGRAPKMRAYIDHVLCILPFEPAELKRLAGPPGTYVGHRMTHDIGLLEAAAMQAKRGSSSSNHEKNLVVLPGSRKSEVKGLMGTFGKTVAVLKERGNAFRVVIPTIPRVEKLVRNAAADWPVAPEICVGSDAKWKAFGEADAALAASGTVLLELALCRVPTAAAYNPDRILRMISSVITIWSASLPNLIADWPVVPEFYNEYLRPGRIARHLERLMADTHDRASQIEGFAEVARRMATERPAREIGAEVILAEMEKHRAV